MTTFYFNYQPVNGGQVREVVDNNNEPYPTSRNRVPDPRNATITTFAVRQAPAGPGETHVIAATVRLLLTDENGTVASLADVAITAGDITAHVVNVGFTKQKGHLISFQLDAQVDPDPNHMSRFSGSTTET